MIKYLIILLLISLTPSYAALEVSVVGGDFKPISINIKNFSGDKKLANSLKKVVTNDLDSSGLFKCQGNSAQYILAASINSTINPLVVTYKLSDAKQRVLLAYKLSVKDNLWRYGAHKIADAIYSKLTGQLSYFTSKVIFVDEIGQDSDVVKRIAIMDQDGANIHYLTNGKQLVVTPKLSKNGELLAYTAYVNGVPLTYLQQLKTGRRIIVGLFNNGTIAPSFSQMDPTLIMAVLKDNGNSNLFTINIKNYITALSNTNKAPINPVLQRVTYGESIDSVSSFSPNTPNLVFCSDRSGRQKLYIMDVEGQHLRLLTKDKGSYATPAWSPLGDYIAFTKKTAKGFSIGIIRPDGSDEHILTTSFHCEKPCWAPNGRVIMFFKEVAPGQHKLYSIDIMGRNEHIINTPHGASDPEWVNL